MRTSLAICSMLLLASCSASPKANFFTLSVVPDNSGSQTAVSYPVQLAAVHIPPSLDRRQIVRMKNENRVQISDTDRWSASLDEMIRNVLSQDLVARLPEGRVILPKAPPSPGTGVLVVTIAQFGPNANGDVTLNGSWTLLAHDSTTPLLERNFQLDAGPAANADETVAAMSRALGQLASAIASTLSKSEISLSQSNQHR